MFWQFWLYRCTIISNLVLQVCPVSYMTADIASQDAVYHWNSVGTLMVTISPWPRLTMDIYPSGLSSVWWRYIIYVWCGRYSLRNGTYISRALPLQLGLMWIWSNKDSHRVPRNNLQMVLAAWNLSLLSFSFFFPPFILSLWAVSGFLAMIYGFICHFFFCARPNWR